MASAWIYQLNHQIETRGADAASWYNLQGKKRGKSCGPGFLGQKKADKLRRKIEDELETGTHREQLKKTWEEFRQEYEAEIVLGLDPETRVVTATALSHFGWIVQPIRMAGIDTQSVDDFIAVRRQEPGKKKGSRLSPATINKELRHLKAALHVAREWGYLGTVPKFRMEKVPKKLVTYVTGDHFAAIYRVCAHAKLPNDQPYPAAAWWRAVLVMAYMTGWRISDMLGLRRGDSDLDAGFAITRYEDNKGKRDEKVKLHEVVLDHLRKLPGFDPRVFPWNLSRRSLHEEFARIQEKAGIKLPCRARGAHEHTRFCYVYGFHDLRRGVRHHERRQAHRRRPAGVMRHKSYTTTQVYINMARQMDEAVAALHVPEVRTGAVGNQGLTIP
jgi:integrase